MLTAGKSQPQDERVLLGTGLRPSRNPPAELCCEKICGDHRNKWPEMQNDADGCSPQPWYFKKKLMSFCSGLGDTL